MKIPQQKEFQLQSCLALKLREKKTRPATSCRAEKEKRGGANNFFSFSIDIHFNEVVISGQIDVAFAAGQYLQEESFRQVESLPEVHPI